MESKTVNLSIKRIIAGLAIIAVLNGAMVVGAGLLLGVGKQTVTEPAASAASAPTTAVPKHSGKPVVNDDAKAYEIKPGTGDGPGQSATFYQCAASFKAVQVPLGKTIQVDDAQYLLTEVRDDIDYQQSVTLDIKLPKGVSAPVVIVNGADHNYSPDLYGNTKLDVSLKPGGTGKWVLPTEGYVRNVPLNTGILNVVICTKKIG